MTLSEILTIVGMFLLYGGALIGLYINVRVKMKELEVRILTLESDMIENEKRAAREIAKLELKNTHEHEHIVKRIDALMEKLNDTLIAIQSQKSNQ